MKTSPNAQFHSAMLALYDRCAEIGFRPVLLRRYVILKGGVGAAKEMVFMSGQTVLERLSAKGQADVSMEAMMLQGAYRPLFAPAELKEAEKRLAGNTSGRARGRRIAQPTHMERGEKR